MRIEYRKSLEKLTFFALWFASCINDLNASSSILVRFGSVTFFVLREESILQHIEQNQYEMMSLIRYNILTKGIDNVVEHLICYCNIWLDKQTVESRSTRCSEIHPCMMASATARYIILKQHSSIDIPSTSLVEMAGKSSLHKGRKFE